MTPFSASPAKVTIKAQPMNRRKSIKVLTNLKKKKPD
jgi:hypothetical protein